MKVQNVSPAYMPVRNINNNSRQVSPRISPRVSPSFTGVKYKKPQINNFKMMLLSGLSALGLFKLREDESKKENKILFEAYKSNPELTKELALMPYKESKYVPKFSASDVFDLVELNKHDPDFFELMKNQKQLSCNTMMYLAELHKSMPEVANRLAVSELDDITVWILANRYISYAPPAEKVDAHNQTEEKTISAIKDIEAAKQAQQDSLRQPEVTKSVKLKQSAETKALKLKQLEETEAFIRKYSNNDKPFTSDEISIIPMCVENIPAKFFKGRNYFEFKNHWERLSKPHVYDILNNLSIIDKNMLILDMIYHESFGGSPCYYDTDLEALESRKKRLAQKDAKTLQEKKKEIENFIKRDAIKDIIKDKVYLKPIKTLEDANRLARQIKNVDLENCSEEELLYEIVIPLEKINRYLLSSKPDSHCDVWGDAAESIYQHITNGAPLPDNVKDLYSLNTSGIAYFDTENRGIFRYNFTPVFKNTIDL